uniref:Uncharacterized protein n=1 Tax=uncultured bacterium BAC17H8 TaxID=332980 RepID=Q4JMT5_9BACT|nr:unknown [uncultured bacterium BAC17H8]
MAYVLNTAGGRKLIENRIPETTSLLTLSRQTPKRGTTCHRCQVIRFFVVSAIGLAIFALVADDKLHYLQAVTPMRAALAIWAVGIGGLAIKIILWKLETRQVNSDPGQGEPPAAC